MDSDELKWSSMGSSRRDTLMRYGRIRGSSGDDNELTRDVLRRGCWLIIIELVEDCEENEPRWLF